MYLDVPDQQGFVFPNAFQSVGLGLASGIGAAVARPERLSVAAVGDGGALMALGELETAARYRLPMLVVVYNDAAYGAEVHHFGPWGVRWMWRASPRPTSPRSHGRRGRRHHGQNEG